MALDAREIAKLRRIIAISEKLITFSPRPKQGRPASAIQERATKLRKRMRRTGNELIEFRQMLKTELKNGIPVAKIAKKHGVSASYVHQL